MTDKKFDIVIVGGGIAGLWTLALAQERGYNAILLEKSALGCGQTLSSQGIIHGGSKYALAGKLSKSTHMISAMPGIWQSAYSGNHVIDLTKAQLLSTSQYLVPSTGIDTKLLSFLGSKTMRSHTTKVVAAMMPEAYKKSGINQSAFQLNEIVFDTQSVIQCFYQKYHPFIYQYHFNADNIKQVHPDQSLTLQLDNNIIKTEYLVLACGEGYAALNQQQPAMQIRPLHMVIVKGKNLPLIYAHFIGRSTKPLLTITSHPDQDNEHIIWYLGGGLAEDGVGKSEEEQTNCARNLLQKLTPGINLDQDLKFFCYSVNRAEQKQNNLTRPDDAFIMCNQHIISGWPTKLALAPRFAEKVLDAIKINNENTISKIAKPLLDLPAACIANYPWYQL